MADDAPLQPGLTPVGHPRRFIPSSYAAPDGLLWLTCACLLLLPLLIWVLATTAWAWPWILWNELEVFAGDEAPAGSGPVVEVEGEGEGELAQDGENLVARSMAFLFRRGRARDASPAR